MSMSVTVNVPPPVGGGRSAAIAEAVRHGKSYREIFQLVRARLDAAQAQLDAGEVIAEGCHALPRQLMFRALLQPVLEVALGLLIGLVETQAHQPVDGLVDQRGV